MPKERFNEEKQKIGTRIQALIAQGESITQMMDVSLSPSPDGVEREERQLRLEGEASPEEGSQGGHGGIPRRVQGAGRGLLEAARGAHELQGEQPPPARGEADSGHPEHHRVAAVAGAAGALRVPHPVHGKSHHTLPELHVHQPQRLPAHAGVHPRSRAGWSSLIAPRVRAVLHVLHHQRRLQLRSAHLHDERPRDGAARHADHLSGVQRRVSVLTCAEA